ncbi:hypothetical protein V6R21_18935 [Limibacter armeniacum]|uniref:hypothetical protein n=1 Tax=Limibacter armeniacum TaxID=466084 RepID=UPI002FE6169F
MNHQHFTLSLYRQEWDILREVIRKALESGKQGPPLPYLLLRELSGAIGELDTSGYLTTLQLKESETVVLKDMVRAAWGSHAASQEEKHFICALWGALDSWVSINILQQLHKTA